MNWDKKQSTHILKRARKKSKRKEMKKCTQIRGGQGKPNEDRRFEKEKKVFNCDVSFYVINFFIL